MVQIIADTHCHTVASSHAYSTVDENAAYAASVGMKVLAITDHAPGNAGCSAPMAFYNLVVLPRTISGVVVLRGAEANIVDYEGNLDLDNTCYSRLDWINASIPYTEL